MALAQIELSSDSLKIDYSAPREYELGGITISGAEHFDQRVLSLLTGLTVGEKIQIPGDKVSKAIDNLWKQGLFADIKISIAKVQGKNVFLDVNVTERPRLSKFQLKGVTKSEADDIREKVRLIKGKVVTDYLITSTITTIKDFFIDKGFMNVDVGYKEEKDTTISNGVTLYFNIKKGDKVRIDDIVLHRNKSIVDQKRFLGLFRSNGLSDRKLLKAMKETKPKRWWNVFNSGKYLEENFENEKPKMVEKFTDKGYRDARIVKDTVYKVSANRVKIEVWFDEGRKYYFRHITWVGNNKYTSKELGNVLGIKKGDLYNQQLLDSKLNMNMNGSDVSSLYMDDGYLFFRVEPVEVLVENDSIDLEMRIYEGKQATINKVTVVGNTKTNDRVIIRELRTRPGQLFRRSDIIRTQRELSQLGYFNAEKLGVNPVPNPATGTVDIEYTVEEKPSDQLELSGGFGAGRIVGTLGLSFTNFSARNIFKGSAWRPLPAGDGQRLSIRAQSFGVGFQSYTLSFMEPWLGGKKPNSMSVSLSHSNISNGFSVGDPGRQGLQMLGGTVGFGVRLRVPDDYFALFCDIGYTYYDLQNYQQLIIRKGHINDLNLKLTLSRNSVDAPIFARRGSNISLSAQLTPPYSFFNGKDYSTISLADRYRFLEYQKWKFTATWYTSLTNKRAAEGKEARNLVLYTKLGLGYVGNYNDALGEPIFQRFFLGGSGLTGFNLLDGREIIALRGYTDRSVFSGSGNAAGGGATIAKYTAELRYPISLNPSATLWALAFVEGGNSWSNFKEFNPFAIKRSAGVGIRVFLPMFGLLGFDYAWGFDPTGDPTSGRNPASGEIQGQFHFTIGATLGEL